MIKIDIDQNDFLKIRETLTRIGIAGRPKRLIQTAHILHKKGNYYIVHFKEMFLLDGKARKEDISSSDLSRVLCIVELLKSWNLIKDYECDEEIEKISLKESKLFILKSKDKDKMTLVSNYQVGAPYNIRKKPEETETEEHLEG